MNNRTIRILTGIITAIALTFGASTTAHADGLDPRITYALDAQPGGILTSSTTIAWPELGMVLTLPPAVTTRGLSAKCPVGLTCAFQSANEGGARLTWSTCGTFSTTALATVGSVANARSTGTLQARNGTTVIASTSAGNFVNVYSTVNNVRCL